MLVESAGMKSLFPAALLALAAVACGDKAPPPPVSPPKPKVEAVIPAAATPRPPEAPSAPPASAGQDAPKK
jgi:hypothetical protein